MEKFIPNQKTGYALIKVDSTFLENRRLNLEKVLRYLQINYSEKKVEKERQETDHLPFPFRTKQLE